MKTHFRIVCTGLLLVLTACSHSHPAQTAAAAPEPATCGSVRNLHIAGEIYLAGQPAAEDFELLQAHGIKTIINLRLPQEMADLDEAQIVERLGMTYVYLPWNGADQLTDARLDEMRRLLRESERPLLLHCASANRVGAAWLAYRVLDEGIAIDQALAEAREVGMRTPAYEQKTLAYIQSNQ